MNDPDISEASVKDMVAAGKGILRLTESGKEAFIATQKVNFKVEKLVEKGEGDELIDTFEVAKDVVQKVYALTEMDIVPHDPKSAGASTEDND
jgi:hypothetical protein